MDLDLFLAMNALMVSAMILAATVIYRTGSVADSLVKRWPLLAVNAIVLVVGALAFWLAPDRAALLILLAFVPLVATPLFLQWLSQRHVWAGQAVMAARLARWAAIFQPTAANRLNARLLTAQTGTPAANIAALRDLVAAAPAQFRLVVRAQLALAERDWSEILALSNSDGAADAVMKPLEIRALGETGRTEAMVRCYWTSRSKIPPANLALTRLIVLAFGGRPDAVVRLLGDKFKVMDKDVRAYWTAVAYLNSAANAAPGERTLTRLADSAGNEVTKLAASRQLTAYRAKQEQGLQRTLSRETAAGLDALAAQVMADTTDRASPLRAMPVTIGFIALNGAAFGVELIQGVSQDSDGLISLGALWPPDVLQNGEWWRLLTASFLHFGPVHLASNMLVLYVLGQLLEPVLGRSRLAIVYVLGGIASSAFVLGMMWAGYTAYGLLVGASGAIFALLGARVTMVLLEWWRAPASFETRQLWLLGVMLALQMGMDLSVPNISFAAHASGFISGLLMMLALSRYTRRPARTGSPVSPQTPTGSET